MSIPVVLVMEVKDTTVPLSNPCAVRVTVSPESWNVTETESVTPVPNTLIPTARLEVLDWVTVLDPLVVPHEVLLMAVSAPQLPEMVMVGADTLRPRLANTAARAAGDSLQLSYDMVWLVPERGADERLPQLLKMVAKFPVATAEVFSDGTVVREVQPMNMLVMLVTEAVLNNGTLVRE